MTEEPVGWASPRGLIKQAMDDLGIDKPKDELVDADIKEVMHYIGMCAADTDLSDPDNPKIGRIGIGLMLTVTLLEFPEYYMKYELSQFN
jgi:hypothetical protein